MPKPRTDTDRPGSSTGPATGSPTTSTVGAATVITPAGAVTDAEVVMLDNFSPEQVKQALKLIRDKKLIKPIVEVSGGISEKTIASYVIPGVDVISSGSLTHSVIATDLSLLIQ